MDAPLRPAVAADAAELVRLRCVMLADIGEDPERNASWQQACRRTFEQRLGHDLLAVVVPREDGRLAAAAVGVVQVTLPGPQRPDGRTGYLLNVCTDRDMRRRGLARACVRAVLDRFDALGVSRVELHATGHGERLYRELGFAAPPYPGLVRRTG